MISGRSAGTAAGPATRAAPADEQAAAARQWPKKLAVERSPRLRTIVLDLLREDWSPASIAGRLPIDYPTDQACRVSREGITGKATWSSAATARPRWPPWSSAS